VVDRNAARINIGDLIARIVPDPETPGSPRARVTDMQLRSALMENEAPPLQAAKGSIEADLEREELGLRSRVELLEGPVRQADLDLVEARRKLARAEQDLETAERLKRLNATVESDYQTALRATEAAKAEIEKAQTRRISAQQELAAANEAVEQFQNVKQRHLDEAEVRIHVAHRNFEILQAVANPLRANLLEENGQVLIKSPGAGMLLDLDTTQHSHIALGEPLLTLYEPQTKIIRAFVSVRFRDRVKQGMPVRMYIKGRKGPIAGKVERVQDRIMVMPRALAANLAEESLRTIPVDISPVDVPVEQFLPGETGKLVVGE
jgi:hypothetical protein